MNVLLTGATGFLGFRLLETLSQHNGISKLIAAGRTIRPSHFVDHPKISYHPGDFRKANTLATRYLVQAAARHGVNRFVFISSSSVYVNKQDRFNVSESDPLVSAEEAIADFVHWYKEQP